MGIQNFFQNSPSFVAPGIEVHVHGLQQLVGDLASNVLGLSQLWDHGFICVESRCSNIVEVKAFSGACRPVAVK